MMRKTLVSTVAIAAAAVAVPGHAQDSSLSGLDLNSPRSEIQQRYDAALALSTDPAIVSGDNSRYVWANEAKVQCGIALGYLKSSTRDEVSIGKCEMAARLMNRVPAPYTPPPPNDDPTSPIPLPAAGWLLLGGLGALAAVRRRKQAA